MTKHKYQVNLEDISEPDIPGKQRPAISFNVTCNDDLFHIIEKLEQSGIFPGQSAKAFGVGLKLFSQIMLENKNNPLFDEFAPAFGQFMKKLKKQNAPDH